MDTANNESMKLHERSKNLSPIFEEYSLPRDIEMPDHESVFQMFNYVVFHLSKDNYEPKVLEAIMMINGAVKLIGDQLEHEYPEKLDQFQKSLRKACKNRELDIIARLKLLEVLELRSLHWKGNEKIDKYYMQKYCQLKEEQQIDIKGALEPLDTLKYRIEYFLKDISTSFNASQDVNSQSNRPIYQSYAPEIILKITKNIQEDPILCNGANLYQKPMNCAVDLEGTFKKLYLGDSIFELNNKARIDAASALNPLMADYAFENLCKILKEAGEVYNNPKECDEERAYILYKKFTIVYKEQKKSIDFQQNDQNQLTNLRKDVHLAHNVLDIIAPHLSERYLKRQKSNIYVQAKRLINTSQFKHDITSTKATDKEQPLHKADTDIAETSENKNIEIGSNISVKQQAEHSNSINNMRGRYLPDKCYKCGDYEYIINVGDRGYIMLQGSDFLSTKSARLVLQNFIKWGMSKRIENKEPVADCKKTNTSPQAQRNKNISYDRETLLAIAETNNPQNKLIPKPILKKSEENLEKILANHGLLQIQRSIFERSTLQRSSDPVFPNYVQSIFKDFDSSSSGKSLEMNKVIQKTIRATVETWDQAATKWINV